MDTSSRSLVIGGLMLAWSGCVSLTGLGDLSAGPVALDAAPEVEETSTSTLDADVDSGLDADSESDAGVLLHSCKELRGAGVTVDGVRRIDPDGDGPVPPVDVYCEMTIAGGGWTLVARSVEDATGPFGWHVARGLVTDDTAPYALGDPALTLGFTEVLLATRDGDAKAVGDIAYKISIMRDDVTANETTGFTDYDVSTVRGECEPTSGPNMLHWSGYTSRATSYFFSNSNINDDYVLRPSGFETYFGDCTNGGSLDGLQGMLFVR